MLENKDMNTLETHKYTKPTWMYGLFGIVALLGMALLVGAAVITTQNSTNPIPKADGGYGTVGVVGEKTGIPAAQAPDMNVNLRGKVAITGIKDLIASPNTGSLVDPRAPKICTMFTPMRKPEISNLYAIHKIGTDGRTVLDALEARQPAAISFKTTANEQIKMPATGVLSGNTLQNPYNIGGGYEAMVQYADNDSIFLHVSSHDVNHIDGVEGYAMHITNINTDPALVSLYQSLNSQGRNALPAVKANQVLGTAKGGEVTVYIRDSGDFLDPRWIADWWTGCPGVNGAPNPTPTGGGSSATPTPNPTPTDGGGAQAGCYSSCYSATNGNGSGCRYVCDNKPACWQACKSEGKACLNKCINATPTPQVTPTVTSTPTPTSSNPTAVSACFGNATGVGGRCYDCNGDATINILDFACFSRRWLNTVN